jgi:localization factor PodJL
MRRQRFSYPEAALTPLFHAASLLARPLRAALPLLLTLGLLLPSPVALAEVTKPTVKKPTVAKPAPVKKPVASKPQAAKAQPAKTQAKPRRATKPVVAGVTAASAAALALGTAPAPALPGNADPALRNLEADARQGNVEAQMALAEHFASGTPPDAADMRRAVYWYGQAAAKGDADASWTLAELFRGDLGLPPDLEQAASWYRKAAEMGHAEAAFDLGLLYMEGYGLERDPAQAAVWFEQAADAGIARAHYMLGALFEQGVDGAPDRDAAAGWYARAAESGDVNARAALARLAAGQDNVALADGPPPGMIGGPPGGAAARRVAVSNAGVTNGSQASGAAPGARPVAVDQDGVKEIQSRLAKLGYHKGKADGFLGKRTVAAIRAYQQKVGMKADGKVSQALLERLRRG